MFNLLKSDGYRLVHGKMLWVALALLLAVVACGAGLVWFASTPMFAEMVNEQTQQNLEESGSALTITTPNDADLTEDEVQILNEKVIDSRTYSYGNTIMVGFLGVIVSVLAALIAASDFDSGFVKNVLTGRRSRLGYFGGKLVLIALLCGAYLLVGMAASDAAYALAGFTYERVETVAEFWGWTALSWLELTAFAFLAALVVWATRSKVAGILLAALVPSGVAESALMTAAIALAPAFPALGEAVKWLPLSTSKLLAAGGTGLLEAGEGAVVAGLPVAGQALLVFGVLAAVCAAVTLAACHRRDVA